MERHRNATEGTIWTFSLPSTHGFHIDGGEVLPRQSPVQVSPGMTRLILKHVVTKTNWESSGCEGQKEEASQAESSTGSRIPMWKAGLEITVLRHWHVWQTDQCVDEDEKSCGKVSNDLVWRFRFDWEIFRPSPLDKFSESFWRWTFYFLAHVYSLWALADKPWVWNTFECWYGYPNHYIGSKPFIQSPSLIFEPQRMRFGATTW